MRPQRIWRWLSVGVMLMLPVLAHAQEATLSGTVTDSTGGALPGVTLRAVHEATGNNFEAVTDERGGYRFPVRIGTYKVTTELAGFSPVTRTVEVQVGQAVVLNLQLSLSSVQETVNVTGEAPLLNTTQSEVGSTIDQRQMEDLPINGRNWMNLVTLAPGSRLNAVGADAAPSDSGLVGASSGREGTDFELNIDGQQVTQIMVGAAGATKSHPKYSRDALAEFEFISNRFDATQGRSVGMQVNAVTKSGANQPFGSFAGYFRSDKFNAEDPVTHTVLPYKDQQWGGTFGGPIVKDKVHFFGNYEYEREPKTFVYNTPIPYFNGSWPQTHTEHKGTGRLDAQLSTQNRFSVRGVYWKAVVPGGGGSTNAPPPSGGDIKAFQVQGTLTSVLSNRNVNEIKLGYVYEHWNASSYAAAIKNPNSVTGANGPSVDLAGFASAGVGGSQKYPDSQGQDVYSVRDDFSTSFSRGGRHTMKVGAEYLYFKAVDGQCLRCLGELDATGGSPANINFATVFPDYFDATTWNLAPLSPLAKSWQQAISPPGYHGSTIPRYTMGFWAQDDWSVTSRLTLNLGVRYDLELNAFDNSVVLGPFLTGTNQHDDKNNVAPRLGFNYSLNDQTVIRGGGGIYFGTVQNDHYAEFYANFITAQVTNDGRPDFASNPFNGSVPTFQSLQAQLCTPALVKGCILPSAPTGGAVYGPGMTMPLSYQASLGVQRQLGPAMAFNADYVYSGQRDNPRDLPANVSYNAATGLNNLFSNQSLRPVPYWGYVSLTTPGYRGNLHSLQTSFTKRMSHNWQASATYTLSVLRDNDPAPRQFDPGTATFNPLTFAVAPDLGGEYTYAVGDQRHRATFNGIWQLTYGFQLSGLYFYGSGQAFFTNWGTDLRGLGGQRPNQLRLRPDGTVVPRNNLIGDPIHRVDLRLQREFKLAGRAHVDGMLELYNVFNHSNYGSYTTQESNSKYGQPNQSTLFEYGPRALQLAFRFAF